MARIGQNWPRRRIGCRRLRADSGLCYRSGVPETRRKTKGSEPLSEVLYLRVSPTLKRLLSERADRERIQHPGHMISEADVAREILLAELDGDHGETG